MAVAAISMAVLFIHFAGTAAWNLIHVSAPGRLSAQIAGLQSMGSYAIASVGPIITGWLLDKYGWGVWYPTMAGFGVLGGIAMLMVMRKQKRLAQAQRIE